MTTSRDSAPVAAAPNPLRRLRREREFSQAQLASMIGTQRTTIAAWEQGRQRPQERFMSRLASALGVDWSVLAPLRPESGAAVLRIASRDTALDPGEAPLEPAAQAPDRCRAPPRGPLR